MPNLVSENEMFFTQFEPKLQNRFIMYIDGVPSYMVRAAGRPQIVQEAKPLPHINLERYVKGKTRWQAVNVTLYDPIVPSGAQTVMEWIRLGHESVTGRNGYMDFYKKDIIFNVLGPVGDKVEEWIAKAHIASGDTVQRYGYAYSGGEAGFTIQSRFFGGDLINSEGTKTIFQDDEQALRGLRWTYDKVVDQKFTPVPGAFTKVTRPAL